MPSTKWVPFARPRDAIAKMIEGSRSAEFEALAANPSLCSRTEADDSDESWYQTMPEQCCDAPAVFNRVAAVRQISFQPGLTPVTKCLATRKGADVSQLNNTQCTKPGTHGRRLAASRRRRGVLSSHYSCFKTPCSQVACPTHRGLTLIVSLGMCRQLALKPHPEP